MVNVSYDDALAYVQFIGGRLPYYGEWLYATTGSGNRKYPWGDDLRADLCNVRESGIGDTCPVGTYSPEGDSPFGCSDVIGNVWEWTATPIDENGDMLLALGGGWDHFGWQTEIPLDRWYRNRSVGFRIAREL